MSNQFHLIEFAIEKVGEVVSFIRPPRSIFYIFALLLLKVYSFFAQVLMHCWSLNFFLINGSIKNTGFKRTSKYFGTEFQDSKGGHTFATLFLKF